MNFATSPQLPADIRERVFDVLTDTHAPQWIETDPTFGVTRCLGSQLLTQARPGMCLIDVLPCLVGAHDIAPIAFPVVNLDGGNIVDVHLFTSRDGFEVLLIDASEQHAETRETQQQAHEIALLNRRLEKLTVELDRARTEAESASEAKSRLIAGMSHEFRTPLTSVMGFADLMSAGIASNEEGLTGIRESAVYLLSLVDNLLEHGSSDHGPIVVNLERVSADGFFAGVIAQVQPLADKQQLQLSVSGPEGDLDDLVIDPIRCRQILINLLTNAIRHTPKGHITLHWRTIQHRLAIEVTDTGCGISSANLERIFSPFERGDDMAGRPGAGLGLAISRQLAEAMGGRLDVTSQLGQGSTFALTLPLADVDTSLLATMPNDHPVNQVNNVLVVDDDPNIGAVLRLCLTDAGFKVTLCRSLSETEQQLETGLVPRVALVDLDLYGSDGLQVVDVVKQRFPDLCVFAMSAAASSQTRERIRAAGCAGFIPKPFELQELAELVEKAASAAQETP
ncbi:MAG: ATP-binding protein [Lysobacterales bacterium]